MINIKDILGVDKKKIILFIVVPITFLLIVLVTYATFEHKSKLEQNGLDVSKINTNINVDSKNVSDSNKSERYIKLEEEKKDKGEFNIGDKVNLNLMATDAGNDVQRQINSVVNSRNVNTGLLEPTPSVQAPIANINQGEILENQAVKKQRGMEKRSPSISNNPIVFPQPNIPQVQPNINFSLPQANSPVVAKTEVKEEKQNSKRSHFNSIGDEDIKESSKNKSTYFPNVRCEIFDNYKIATTDMIHLRLTNDIDIGSTIIPRNTVITAKTTYSGSRVMVSCKNIDYDGKEYAVNYAGWDLDGGEGIHINSAPGNINSANAENYINSGNTYINDAISIAKGIFKKKTDQSINLKEGYILILKNKEN